VGTGEDSGTISGGVPSWETNPITEQGREFIDHWLAAEPLE
jgi:hypothetical protein